MLLQVKTMWPLSPLNDQRWTTSRLYPGCVGGERRLSPPTQPGYEATVYVDVTTMSIKVSQVYTVLLIQPHF